MKLKISVILLIITPVFLISQENIQNKKNLKNTFNFIIANDLGRNGRYDQKYIAELMGEVADYADANFIISIGDLHHYLGIKSIKDPLWMTNYELIYSHPGLQIEWYPVLGNHEYKGNTQAVIDYSNISRRWVMKDRYYTQVHKIDNNESIRIVYVDTPPLIEKYRTNPNSYPDAEKQNHEKQLKWIDSVLSISKEKWKIVVGHHPIYAQTNKDEKERSDLQKNLNPILEKYGVDMYICGHIHNFQHIKPEGKKIDYVVNTSGSLSRKVSPLKETLFCDGDTGFSVFSASSKEIILLMINKKGEVIHEVKKRK